MCKYLGIDSDNKKTLGSYVFTLLQCRIFLPSEWPRLCENQEPAQCSLSHTFFFLGLSRGRISECFITDLEKKVFVSLPEEKNKKHLGSETREGLCLLLLSTFGQLQWQSSLTDLWHFKTFSSLTSNTHLDCTGRLAWSGIQLTASNQ